jgi:hypothetical protein
METSFTVDEAEEKLSEIRDELLNETEMAE